MIALGNDHGGDRVKKEGIQKFWEEKEGEKEKGGGKGGGFD